MQDPDAPAPEVPEEPVITLEGLEFQSDHGLLKGCKEDTGWKDAGAPCGEEAWSPGGATPVSHTMDRAIRVALALRLAGGGEAQIRIRGAGPEGLHFEGSPTKPGRAAVTLSSSRRLRKRIHKLDLQIRWSAPGAEVSPASTRNVVYVTMGRPRDGADVDFQEDGVTLKRMDTAVSWVAPLDTLDPHAIVAGLMAKFPYYSLLPSPKVPRQFHHPTYFNDKGGAWAMAAYVEESGECQAIVRLIRAILRQLGVPGVANIVVVWADPNVKDGRTALWADWEKDSNAGLDATMTVEGRRWIAALVDAPVEEGKTYPPSHTVVDGGDPSPGLNRYEACLKFTYRRKTRYYAGGAGEFEDKARVLDAFWGLVWVSSTPDDGFRVEKIVRRFDDQET